MQCRERCWRSPSYHLSVGGNEVHGGLANLGRGGSVTMPIVGRGTRTRGVAARMTHHTLKRKKEVRGERLAPVSFVGKRYMRLTPNSLKQRWMIFPCSLRWGRLHLGTAAVWRPLKNEGRNQWQHFRRMQRTAKWRSKRSALEAPL